MLPCCLSWQLLSNTQLFHAPPRIDCYSQTNRKDCFLNWCERDQPMLWSMPQWYDRDVYIGVKKRYKKYPVSLEIRELCFGWKRRQSRLIFLECENETARERKACHFEEFIILTLSLTHSCSVWPKKYSIS